MPRSSACWRRSAARAPQRKPRWWREGAGTVMPSESIAIASRRYLLRVAPAKPGAHNHRYWSRTKYLIRHPEVRARRCGPDYGRVLRGPCCARPPQDDGDGFGVRRTFRVILAKVGTTHNYRFELLSESRRSVR